ncbi:Patatin-like phospholipase [Novymonas esmeraldas]|uniref:Patatin-like phospholipase n=1 Tax=Novymonas esmeraldas TaxID=1808958 RepID=A0AAW0ES08_9TRYP
MSTSHSSLHSSATSSSHGGGGGDCNRAPQPSEPAEEQKWDVTVSFSCGGWFQMYFFGAAYALVDSGVLQRWYAEGKRVRFTGVSAGSLAASCLASGQYDLLSVKQFAAAAAEDFRSSIFHWFRMGKYLVAAIDHFGTNLRAVDTDPHMRQVMESGALEVGVTVLPKFKSHLISSFSSYAAIRETLIASCCLVPLVGLPFKMESTGEWCADGGISNFTPRMEEENTISVSAMYFQDASVRPRVFVPSWWALRPPNSGKYNNLFWMGYNDMIDYLVGAEHLSVRNGSYLLKQEVDFRVHDTYGEALFSVFMELMMLIYVKPVVIIFVYVELAVSMAWWGARGILTWDGASFRNFYDSFRNAVSLRTLGRLIFGSKVPNNEERLSRQSRVFRVFDSVALGGNKATGRECWSPSGTVLLGRVPTLSPNARRAAEFPRGK